MGSMIFWLDSLVTAGLCLYGASAFENAIQAKCDNRVPFLLQARPHVPAAHLYIKLRLRASLW